ncbi:MAG: HNH endonuclease [Rhodobacteraceae bacterium]|nr:HNH endonuclease [Paracoccaceae bacterium]MAY44668.1 HNH endonuclease [Paracoccaceae bacterium]
MKGQWIEYSKDELAWIEANSTRTRREAHADFQGTFARPDVSLSNFNSLCKRKGWMTGRTGQYNKGRTPENKGMKCAPGTGGRHPNARKTQFKKGHQPHTWRGAGHERICSKDGYVVMIVDEPNPWTGAATRPVHKHRYLWEKANGPIPEGHVLKCLDGDKTNTDPSNWELIPQALLPRLSGGRWYQPYDAYEPELRPTVLASARLDHAVREAKRGGQK